LGGNRRKEKERVAEMNLDEVKYRRCSKCRKSMPLAHYVPKVYESNKNAVDEFAEHSNTLCQPCIRAEIEFLMNVEPESLRIDKLSQMLASA